MPLLGRRTSRREPPRRASEAGAEVGGRAPLDAVLVELLAVVAVALGEDRRGRADVDRVLASVDHGGVDDVGSVGPRADERVVGGATGAGQRARLEQVVVTPHPEVPRVDGGAVAAAR